MIVTWAQSRRVADRICWSGKTNAGAVYRLRASQVNESTVLLELYRLDRGGELAQRRDGVSEVVAMPSGGLDQIKNIALTWGVLHVR